MKVYVYPLLETLERAKRPWYVSKVSNGRYYNKTFSRAYLGGYEAKNHYKDGISTKIDLKGSQRVSATSILLHANKNYTFGYR